VVPADLRLLAVAGLECDESVRAGSGTGVVVATGGDAEFGRIAVGLGQQQPETEFQVGLRKFSMLLVQVAGALTGAIFVINVALHKPVLDALLFSLAIAVGMRCRTAAPCCRSGCRTTRSRCRPPR
jgi:Mg2+-importing ATPase